MLFRSGYQVPIAVAGKISDPDDAESVIASGKADIVAIEDVIRAVAPDARVDAWQSDNPWPFKP